MEAHLWVRIGPYATPHLLTCLPSYPAASRQHMHITKAYLPADVAKALAVNPLLVQKAVETFYTRDDTYNLHADVPPPPLLRAFPLRPTAKYLGRVELLPYELGVCRPCHLD